MTRCLLLAVLLSSAGAAQIPVDGPWRPWFHFTPARNWTNDPNGPVFFDGEYHLFYQHNPFGDTWGHMSWGHAVSRDLLHWEHLPVALAEENGIMIFSGSTVVDRGNTSGLCADRAGCLIAIYTGHTAARQTQNLAFSNDRGRTWTKYAANPVLDLGMKDFRDPKVFWHEPDRRWIMVAALPVEHRVRFFGSADLRHWTALSDFGPAGATGGVWECPDLFPLRVEGAGSETRWVLSINLNPGGIAGGSGNQYFIGRFDGRQFLDDNPPERVLWADYGKDFYASTSFSNLPGRRVWIGWMSNWLYAAQEPTSPFRGAMSIPRELRLRRVEDGLHLVQEPVTELTGLRRHVVTVEGDNLSDLNRRLRAARGDALEIVAELEAGEAAEFGLKVRKSAGAETVIGVRRLPPELFVDRTHSGNVAFHQEFAGRHAGPLRFRSSPVRLHIIVDRSSVEVFGNGGDTVLTERIFPPPGSDGVEVYSAGGHPKRVKLQVWSLQ